MAKKVKILFTGGGSGGHIMPLMAVAREIHRLTENPSIKLYYIGPKDEMVQALLMQENFKIYSIVSGKLRSYFSLKNIIDILFKIPLGFLQSFFIMLFLRPALVFSKGGSGSYVVLLCARLFRVPVFLHESDTVPGLSNRLASAWATKIFTSFEKTAYFDLEKAILVGNPILKEVTEGSNELAKEIFHLTFEKLIILFWGGSQGAQPLNDFLLSSLQLLLKNYEIIHVCGKKNYQSIYAEAQVILNKDLMIPEFSSPAQADDLEKYYHLYPFLDEIKLKHAFKASSLIVSRAGSGSIFEIAACGKPSIMVPLPSSAHNHQSKNAYEYQKSGATLVVEQDNLSPNFFMEKINFLLGHKKELEEMKINALRFAKPLAAKAIAREILEYLNAR